jgi:hypothetical protein
MRKIVILYLLPVFLLLTGCVAVNHKANPQALNTQPLRGLQSKPSITYDFYFNLGGKDVKTGFREENDIGYFHSNQFFSNVSHPYLLHNKYFSIQNICILVDSVMSIYDTNHNLDRTRYLFRHRYEIKSIDDIKNLIYIGTLQVRDADSTAFRAAYTYIFSNGSEMKSNIDANTKAEVELICHNVIDAQVKGSDINIVVHDKVGGLGINLFLQIFRIACLYTIPIPMPFNYNYDIKYYDFNHQLLAADKMKYKSTTWQSWLLIPFMDSNNSPEHMQEIQNESVRSHIAIQTIHLWNQDKK